jgi:uncharacterized membrane protein YeaQ/YmgE (transglycosylase-associated protein family)
MKPRTSLAFRILGIFMVIVFGILGAFVGFAIAWFSKGDLGYVFVGGVLGLIAGFAANRLIGITSK